MRFLKVVTIVMGVLIVVATTVLIVVSPGGWQRPDRPAGASVLLDEPSGTRIAGIAPWVIGSQCSCRVAVRIAWCCWTPQRRRRRQDRTEGRRAMTSLQRSAPWRSEPRPSLRTRSALSLRGKISAPWINCTGVNHRCSVRAIALNTPACC